MRIDLCRKCGIELEENKKCDVCGKVNQLFCHNCGNISEEQIHSECYLIKSNYNLLNPTVV